MEAIHLLPEVDVKSVKKYIHQLLRWHKFKKSEFNSECLICTFEANNWQNLVHHLKNPSHVAKTTRDSKQFTAICILCKYILIADNADFLFKHFIVHKTVANKTKKQVLQKSFDNDLACCSLSVNHTSLVDKDDKKLLTSSTKQIYELHKEKQLSVEEGDTFELCEGVETLRHESVSKNDFINQENVLDKYKAQSPVGHNKIKKCNHSFNCYLPPPQKNIHHYENVKTTSKINVETTSKINVETTSKINVETTSQNFSSEKSEASFYPKHVFFCSTGAFQLLNPGVSKSDFFFNSKELNFENIRDHYTGAYYGMYYSLRKLYFSCMYCKAKRLPEKVFYKHLTGVKHSKNVEDDCIGYIKICDICQELLLGHFNLLEEHFQFNSHKLNVKFKLGLIKQQFAVKTGALKLGWSGNLTKESRILFSSKEALERGIESSFEKVRNVASSACSISYFLESDIRTTLKEKYTKFEVKIVGSRLYELAHPDSDVDIHLDIGDVAVGDIAEYFHRATDLFEVMRVILDAKVPIIRLIHLRTHLICDINTTNRKGPHCSELIKLYLSLDERVRWVAVAIREWSTVNDIRGSRKFTSYGLMTLVFFYLMSPTVRLIPPVLKLQSLYEDSSRVIIKGWDHSFCRDIEKIKKIHNPLLCKLSKYELLVGFFEYYSVLDTKSNVLFPLTGKVYHKVAYANPNVVIYPGIHTNLEDSEPLSVGGRFMVIDFFNLRENVNRTVDENLLDHFKSICHQTLLCGWQN